MKTGISIKATKDDLDRFEFLTSERARLAAATIWACLRILQQEFVPGHRPLELIVEQVPKAYLRDWAKKLLAA